ncbi:Non-specific serine/threonine protein kinase protein, partial [Dioscorea alata]
MITIDSQSPAPGNLRDQHALLSFKSWISNEPSGALASWNDSVEFCQWYGVTCGRRHIDRVTALNLDSLNLVGIISPFLGNLTFLRRLNLSNNKLEGQMPHELDRLYRIQHLDLSLNSLEGKIPSTLSHCSKLQTLNLRNNKLEGGIPGNLSSCPDLQAIELGSNMLVGHIPSELGLLRKLNILSLTRNDFTGGIPFSLGNLSSLTYLALSSNILSGGIPSSLGELSSLSTFIISYNQLSGMIPFSIYNLSDMYYFSIADNQFVGTLPPDMGGKLPELQYLYMYGNQFGGTIPASLSNATELNTVDLSDNNLHGPIHENLGILPRLTWFSLSRNQLEANGWYFLTALTNCSRLRVLELHDNKLGGRLPNTLANLSAHMEWLTLAWNGISGTLPAEIGNLVNLTAIYIGNNLLTGAIPNSVGKLQRLGVLSLSTNQFSGEIPSSIGNLTQLSRIYLAGTDLSGDIPSNLGNCRSLELVNLAYNKLSGYIPKELVSISSLSRYLYLSHNSLTGHIPLEVGRLKNLKELDLSDNDLSGEIPSSLGDCQVLEILRVSANSLQGAIPDSLGNLKGLQELDVSQNNLSGNIPDFFGSFHFLQSLNLSFNQFVGKLPDKGVFLNVSAVSIVGNYKLCGGSLGYDLPPCAISSSQGKHKSHATVILVSSIGAVLCFILFIAVITWYLWIKRSTKQSPSAASVDHYKMVSYAQLFKATGGFSEANLLGVGSFGSVYKGVLDESEETIAVKVLNLQRRGALKSFMAECEAMKNIRHRNLMKILNTCSSLDFSGNEFRSLIFEYMPNGSLEKWLHPQDDENPRLMNLDLGQRLNIAIDVASALDYLHHQYHTTVVHCDLKPNNILLDNDMKALVSDFGLARFLSKPTTQASKNSNSSIEIKGTIGYVAPEYGMGARASTWGDVYSYGILLLEMLTGKRPTDEFPENQSLREFVKMAFPRQILNVIEPCLLSFVDDGMGQEDAREKFQECLVSLVGIALSCSQESPRDRMGMRNVCRELLDTK